MLERIRPTYHELEEMILQQGNKIKNLIKFYDDHVGTPCEEIRHRQQVEGLQERIKQLEEELRYKREDF